MRHSDSELNVRVESIEARVAFTSSWSASECVYDVNAMQLAKKEKEITAQTKLYTQTAAACESTIKHSQTSSSSLTSARQQCKLSSLPMKSASTAEQNKLQPSIKKAKKLQSLLLWQIQVTQSTHVKWYHNFLIIKKKTPYTQCPASAWAQLVVVVVVLSLCETAKLHSRKKIKGWICREPHFSFLSNYIQRKTWKLERLFVNRHSDDVRLFFWVAGGDLKRLFTFTSFSAVCRAPNSMGIIMLSESVKSRAIELNCELPFKIEVSSNTISSAQSGNREMMMSTMTMTTTHKPACDDAANNTQPHSQFKCRRRRLGVFFLPCWSSALFVRWKKKPERDMEIWVNPINGKFKCYALCLAVARSSLSSCEGGSFVFQFVISCVQEFVNSTMSWGEN